jgi:hypothetical protein
MTIRAFSLYRNNPLEFFECRNDHRWVEKEVWNAVLAEDRFEVYVPFP